jgi:AraC-like DNA-binding protein
MEQAYLSWLRPPYAELEPIHGSLNHSHNQPGVALVWMLNKQGCVNGELELVESRPRGVSLAVVLPPAATIQEIAPHLQRLSDIQPNAVLPFGRLALAPTIRTAIAGLPRNLPQAVSDYLWRHRIVTSARIRSEVRRIFELAPRTSTVNRLCRDLFMSRRTLGRHFDSFGLPVPSHWLQFARLLNVVLRSQSERTAVFKIAMSAGYPDGFTLSNQARRMTGFRPSEIRKLIGFEWLLERWLVLERSINDPSDGSSDLR